MKKNIKYLVLSLLSISVLFSCIDEDNDELTGDAVTGGLVNVNNPLVTYVVESGATYTAKGSILQGDISTSSVSIYKSFNDNTTGEVSNENLLTTIAIDNQTSGEIANFEYSFTYEDLIEGLALSTGDLPSQDTSLTIGDFWSLSYKATTTTGSELANAAKTKVSVGTRYAGVYNVVESAYWNSGALAGDWNNDTPQVIIESVNASIYKHVGLAYWTDGNEFYFTVDADTNEITILPENPDGDAILLNTSPIMICSGNQFESLTCDGSTVKATPDDANGADQLEFVVGYFRGTGATREFYEKLVKVVE